MCIMVHDMHIVQDGPGAAEVARVSDWVWLWWDVCVKQTMRSAMSGERKCGEL